MLDFIWVLDRLVRGSISNGQGKAISTLVSSEGFMMSYGLVVAPYRALAADKTDCAAVMPDSAAPSMKPCHS
jgi:hypothetical protein